MMKKEKIKTIKEMAGQKKAPLLTEKEIKALQECGYNVPIFLNSHGPITLHTDNKNIDILSGIAKKLDRRIIRFAH
jgi:hypothetical protein